MTQKFPKDPALKRQALLDAVASVKDTLIAGAAEAEAQATLPKASVDALYDSGLLTLKLPEALGGAEADLITQMEVIEAVSRIEPAAGWCLMIGATSMGNMGAYLSDSAIEKVFVGGRPPKAAGVFAMGGKARPVPGGYQLTGRWGFGSGIKHSEWLSAGAQVIVDDQVSTQQLRLAFPTAQAEIHETWEVMGLRGTGSCDFSVTDIFVPDQFVWSAMESAPQRGGPIYRIGRPGNVTNEHSAFALGVGRRALDAITEMAGSKRRGYQNPTIIGQRGAFQRALGEADLKLRAARALAVEVLNMAWEAVQVGETLEPWQHAEMRGSATYSTLIALEVTTLAFQYAGGSALQLSNELQQCLRDLHAAAQHRIVSDEAYENHAQFMLGLPDADPLH